MNKFIINGERRLYGTIHPQGSKNEALQVICATLLTDEIVTIHNIPNISDVQSIIKLLTILKVKITKLNNKSYQFYARYIDQNSILTPIFYQEYIKTRGSIMLLAPLLIRFKQCIIPKPGGDKIGKRDIYAHIEGLEQLGVSFFYDTTQETWTVKCKELKGNHVWMPEPSVTGTANLIMASSMAKGKTVIYPAACEPHIQQLCHMLVAMGANIRGIGSNLLTIEGVSILGKTTHVILSDILEIGSFIGLAAVTQSELTITNVPIKFFNPILYCFKQLGIFLEKKGDELYIPVQSFYKVKTKVDVNLVSIYDGIWPGIPSDLISIAVVTAVHAQGNILIYQKMFESRLFFVDYLIKMGAQLLLCDPHRVYIVGIGNSKKLQGTHMISSDIRSGIALLIAALAAKGKSIIENIDQIDRGYEHIDQRLNRLGASIERI